MADIDSMPWLDGPRTALAALRLRGAHALLLHGPAGTGKWGLAMSLARDLLCENAVSPARACGICASCVLSGAGNHPDLRVVVPDALAQRRPGVFAQDEVAPGRDGQSAAASRAKPSREIRIDQVRELSSLIELTAHRGGTRVVLLGPAESLNLPAANSLLKGLEEPPPATLYVLVSDQIDRCLPTIVSRCALVRVAVPPRKVALDWLQAQGPGDDVEQRLTDSGGAPLAALPTDSEADAEPDRLPPELRAVLLGLLRRGAALAAADVATEVPRAVPVGASVALFQRWGWDYFSFRMGAGLRYHPGEAAAFELLSRDWRLAAAGAWMDSLLSLRRVADHPLNARAAIEGALLEYIGSIGAGREGQ